MENVLQKTLMMILDSTTKVRKVAKALNNYYLKNGKYF